MGRGGAFYMKTFLPPFSLTFSWENTQAKVKIIITTAFMNNIQFTDQPGSGKIVTVNFSIPIK